ncbi:phosphoribosylanthranilate isomerase [Neomegalonema sp.]|uniref:phosphoribosylanthranilate isomerase n=1 Tax=Neomegalonema sp. TaxID=2039713 RepID=UPI00260F21AB|nr:phosphoribosylanthranilate isomerase [Neomegalonema sp.]MDD2868240.1 phosphoribosylanthranilate isomerase [Neomegalonema sp.]
MAEVKICGIRSRADLAVAAEAGARYAGFVFFPPSPRALTPQTAAALAREAPEGLCKVGLFVNPADEDLDAVLELAALDMIQIHKVEDPARLAALRRRAGLPLIAAAPLGAEEDFLLALRLSRAADMILFDARPAPDAALPGGNGLAFDWSLLAGRRWPGPWMLAGGLTPENVAEAVARTGAARVDVSSGVESAPGVKDAAKIRAFARAAGA